MKHTTLGSCALAGAMLAASAVGIMPGSTAARADNSRFNKSVIGDVYIVQHRAGCTSNVTANPQLQLAAQWHADDLLAKRDLDGDIGSDGSIPQTRSTAAGFNGSVAETVAINPALAMSGIELIRRWYDNPDYLAIMQNCRYTKIGVWSVNSLDRTVVVAVYGDPAES